MCERLTKLGKVVWVDHKEVPWANLRRVAIKLIPRAVILILAAIGLISLINMAIS